MGQKRAVLVGQSGGPTVAINASLAGVVAAARRAQLPVLGMRYGVDGLLAGRVVDLDEELPDEHALALLERTPSSYLGSCRYKLPNFRDDTTPYLELFREFDRLGVGAVLYMGGNDSMDTIAKLAAFGARQGSDIRFLGVPKTIDNDLLGTDHTPGYGSAAKFIATSVGEVARDASVYDLKSVLVVEIMGRDAGWLGAAASLAAEPGLPTPDLVLLPEAPQTLDAVVGRVSDLLEHRNTVVVAASEGLRGPGGTLLCEEGGQAAATDAFGHAAALSGTGRYLAAQIKARLGVKTRAVELSTLQRAASHLASAMDLREAYDLGAAAVQAALDGQTGQMMGLERLSDLPYRTRITSVAISDVANAVRAVPASMIAPDGMGVTEEFERYARPLIEGEVDAFFVGGVPRHLPALDPTTC